MMDTIDWILLFSLSCFVLYDGFGSGNARYSRLAKWQKKVEKSKNVSAIFKMGICHSWIYNLVWAGVYATQIATFYLYLHGLRWATDFDAKTTAVLVLFFCCVIFIKMYSGYYWDVSETANDSLFAAVVGLIAVFLVFATSVSYDVILWVQKEYLYAGLNLFTVVWSFYSFVCTARLFYRRKDVREEVSKGS